MVQLPWKKDKPQDESQLPGKMPEEVEEYYEENRRGKRLVAMLLSLGTFIITVVIALALFYGGRWLYRVAFTNNDEQPETVQQDEQTEQDPAPDGDSSASPNDDQNATSNGDPTELPGNSDEPADQTPASGPNEPETTPRTGPGDELPHTGPSSDE